MCHFIFLWISNYSIYYAALAISTKLHLDWGDKKRLSVFQMPEENAPVLSSICLWGLIWTSETMWGVKVEVHTFTFSTWIALNSHTKCGKLLTRQFSPGIRGQTMLRNLDIVPKTCKMKLSLRTRRKTPKRDADTRAFGWGIAVFYFVLFNLMTFHQR